MPQIPRETIDQLRNQVDIADVISQDIQLKKQGKNLMGHCPFHEDATPSFSVNEEKQYFYCFSCHRSGDVFSYLEQAHDLSFMEAVEQVATTAGVDLPRESNGPSGESASPNTPLYRLHEEASRLYHHVLVNTVAGQPALNYLTKRGMSRELIGQFNLGFAPARGEEDLLVKYFTQKGIDYQLMRASGLFTEDQTGQLHDRFFDRVIYPIKNANGQPIAFSGRLLTKKATENAPKYLNSPETPIFNKRRTLFNLDQAKKAARKEGHLTLFEGFMDVISAFGAGVRSGIASMGTSFTDEQVALIARTTDKLTICYDGDAAGQNAINRALTMLAASRLTLRVVQLPAGMDPDEYVQANGQAKFQEYLAHAEETPTAFRLHFLKQGLNLANQSELLHYVEAALREVAKVTDPVERDLYIQQLAKDYHLNSATLTGQVQELAATAAPRPAYPENSPRQPRQAGTRRYQSTPPTTTTAPSTQTPPLLGKVELAQQRLLREMFHNPAVRSHVGAIENFHFVDRPYQLLDAAAKEQLQRTGADEVDVAQLMGELTDAKLRTIVGQIEQRVVPQAAVDETVDDCLAVLVDVAPIEQQIREKTAALQEAAALNDQQLITKLTIELIDLRRQEQKMKTEDVN